MESPQMMYDDIIYLAAAAGDLQTVIDKLKTQQYPDISSVSSKICVIAVLNNRLNILNHFIESNAINSIPDILFVFFKNAILNRCDRDIIEFFLEKGVRSDGIGGIIEDSIVKTPRNDIDILLLIKEYERIN